MPSAINPKTGERLTWDGRAGKWVPQSKPGEDFDFQAGQMIANIPGSAGQLVKDTVTPILHPIDTVKAIGNLGLGIAAKAIPGKQEQEIFADRFGQMVKDRYGSIDNFQRTLQNDPVGVLSDVAGLAAAGGGVAGKVASKGSKFATNAAKASTVGRAIDPVNVATQAATKGFAKIPGIERAAEGLFQRGAKFATTGRGGARAQEAARRANTQTALREGLLPNRAGLDKLRGIVGEINDRIDSFIESADAAGTRISPQGILNELDAVIARRDVPGPNRAKDVKRLERVRRAFIESIPEDVDSLSVSEMQRIKKDIFERVDFNQRRGSAKFINEEGQKAIARGARKAVVAGTSPEVDRLNARQAALLELEQPLAQSANRIANRNIVSIDAPLQAMGGKALAGPAGGAAGAVAGVLQLPQMQTRIAMIMQRIIDKGGTPEMAARLAPLLAAQSAKFAGRAGQQEDLR